MKSALLIVDMQNDYFPGGEMALVGIEAASENVNRILAKHREKNLAIVHVQHFSLREEATFFKPDTSGVEIYPRCKPLDGEHLIRKNYPNSFRETNLLEVLQGEGVTHLIICGAMSHMCIDATTRAAFDLGFQCTVVPDGCATRNLEFQGETIPAASVHGSFMSAFAGVYAQLKKSDEVLADLTARS